MRARTSTDHLYVEFPVFPGRKIKSSPNSRNLQGTTVLVVTQDEAGLWYIESARRTARGWDAARTIFQAKTPGEIYAWMAGNRWNPGGAISRPVA